jgi:hypothetical protein
MLFPSLVAALSVAETANAVCIWKLCIETAILAAKSPNKNSTPIILDTLFIDPAYMKGYINFEHIIVSKACILAGSERATEIAPFDENGNISPDSTWAKSSSFGPVEDVSEDFSK